MKRGERYQYLTEINPGSVYKNNLIDNSATQITGDMKIYTLNVYFAQLQYDKVL